MSHKPRIYTRHGMAVRRAARLDLTCRYDHVAEYYVDVWPYAGFRKAWAVYARLTSGKCVVCA